MSTSEPSASALAKAVALATARARTAYPGIGLDAEAFAQHLLHHHGERGAEGVLEAHVEDLFLALGCARGDAAAIARFDETHMREVPLFVAHLRLQLHEVEEVVQALRVRLLAPGPEGPKILSYSGKGPLGGWVRVAAVRLALRLQSKNVAHADPDAAVAIASAEADPELGLARLHVGQAFKSAFEKSLGELDPQARTALRMHYVDGLTIDQIGTAYAIHRATAARWVSEGRERLAVLTRNNLKALLGVGHRDVESVLRLVDSQLDLSLHRAFGERFAAEDDDAS
jgi:RNA polymerase sigma-70 factor (ECF subfamily)